MSGQYALQNPPREFVTVIDGEKSEEKVFKSIIEEMCV
jgi:hypothetical protein